MSSDNPSHEEPMQRISINSLCNPSDSGEGGHDPDVELAAEALGNLRHSGGASRSTESDPEHPLPEHFLNRVSNIPIVNSALRAYEQSKANSFVVKYGAETVESSVKTICRPVINKLEPQLGQLDDFACRQLDKLEKHYSSFMEHSSSTSYQVESSSVMPSGPPVRFPQEENGELRNRRVTELSSNGHNGILSALLYEGLELTVDLLGAMFPQQSNLQTSRPPHRSRWQQVVLEAGVTAGAGVAVVSEESMKSLRYCQQWLSYASAHIGRQIQLLTNYIASMSASSSTAVATFSPTSNFLAAIKKEVVATLRKVVDVVGRYAGAGLPGEARLSVRNFILSLPGRQLHPCSSPLLTPTSSSLNSPTVLTPTEHANRVLTLASESMTMLQNVGDIFKDTVDPEPSRTGNAGGANASVHSASAPEPTRGCIRQFPSGILLSNGTQPKAAQMGCVSANQDTSSENDAMC
ncbi:transcriptional regulator opi1 [Massospora cicadina]|nr:transcriptional regulator opi1 [Massospora cicadina]